MAGQSRFSMNAVISLIDSFTGPMNRALNAVDKFNKSSQRGFDGTTRAAKGTSFGVGSIIKGIIGANVIQAGLGFIASGFKKIVSEAAKYEMTMAGFTTLLGGNEAAAKKLVNQLQILGAETPFEFTDLANATQMLLGFGAATKDNVIDKLRMLGDLSQGSAERLTRVSRVYGQIMSGGIMKGQDFNQLIDAQVPIAQGLAKIWGVDVDTALKRVKNSGGIMAKDVEAAMIQMTSQGGMFYQGMLRSSKTLPGLWSTFNDAISMTASGIGQELLPSLKDIVIRMTEGATAVLQWVQANKELVGGTFKAIIDTVSTVVKTLWLFRYVILAVVIAWAILKALILATTVTSFVNGLMTLRMAFVKSTLAAWGLNTALLANPITWIILAVAALVAGLVWLYFNWDKVVKYFKDTSWADLLAMAFKIAFFPIWAAVKAVQFIIDNMDKIRNFGSRNVQESQQAGTGSQASYQEAILRAKGIMGGVASPISTAITNTNTTNGNLGITVSAEKGSSAAVTQSGKLPSYLSLKYGTAE